MWIQSLRYSKQMTWSAGGSQDFEVTSGLVPIRHAQHPTSVSGLDHKSIVAMSQLCTEEWNRLDGAGSAGRIKAGERCELSELLNLNGPETLKGTRLADVMHFISLDFTWFYDYLWWLPDITYTIAAQLLTRIVVRERLGNIGPDRSEKKQETHRLSLKKLCALA